MQEWMKNTTLNPIGVAVFIILAIATLAVRRKYAAIPIMIMACFVAPGQNIVIQSTGQNRLLISDAAPSVPAPGGVPGVGGITLRSTTGATIVVNDAGIFIDNGKGASIKLVANVIDLNNGALTVL